MTKKSNNSHIIKKNLTLIITVIIFLIVFYLFITTFIRYIDTNNEYTKVLDGESHNNDAKSDTKITYPKTDDNSSIVKVDDNNTIKIINKYDEQDFKGKKSLIFFWASWCSHCLAENDVLKEAIEKYNNKDFNLYIISHDYEASSLVDYLKANAFNYQIWFDKDRVIRKHIDPEASSVPLTYILDENVNLIFEHDGEIAFEQLENAVNTYLK
ncbi:MAG: TlpA disulfide reductase family protein [Clostridia bacterium]|nr:TlpA disulfide reductase family protein [Clostridia bacterium]MDD4375642.1 TlpA disulfide reductase family protein [Clostridia bacterium]